MAGTFGGWRNFDCQQSQPKSRLPPLILSFSPQARLGELASQRGRIRKRMQLEKGRLKYPQRLFDGPLSHGERDRVRGDSPVYCAIRC